MGVVVGEGRGALMKIYAINLWFTTILMYFQEQPVPELSRESARNQNSPIVQSKKDVCHYLHPEIQPVKKPRFCTYFARGVCKFGEFCRNIHASNDDKADELIITLN